MAIFIALSTEPVLADLLVHIGPPSRGGGGPNPLSIPPINPIDYEFVWISDAQTEWSIGIFPGILYGKRIKAKGGSYLSIGGGMVLSNYAVSPGIYTAFGYDTCTFLCFNFEYKQALGFTNKYIVSPYAIRIGVTFFVDR